MSKTKRGTQVVSAHRRRKDKEPLTPAMALTMLESAVSYCQQSGLNIQAANGDNGTLGLFIPGAHYVLTDNGTRAAFRLGAFYQARDERDAVSNGTSAERVSAREA
jgi:hypothetical protein